MSTYPTNSSNDNDAILNRLIEIERNNPRTMDELQAYIQNSELAEQERIAALKAQQVQNATERKLVLRGVTASRDRSLSEHIEDVALGLSKGVVNTGKVAYGLLDLASRELNPFRDYDKVKNFVETGNFDSDMRGIDQIFADMSDDGLAPSQRLSRITEAFNEGQSDKLQAQRQIVEERAIQRQQKNEATRDKDPSFFQGAGYLLEDFGASMGDLMDHPSMVVDSAIESVPDLLVPGSIANQVAKKHSKNVLAKNTQKQLDKGAGNLSKYNANRTTQKYLASKEGKAYINKVAAYSGVGYAVASEGISNGMEIQVQVLNTDFKELEKTSPEYKRLIDEENLTPEQARRRLANDAGLISTGISALTAGLISKYTGAGKFTGQLFRKDSLLGKSVTRKVAQDTLSEGAEETFQEGVGQFGQNVAEVLSGVDPNKKLTEGVAESAAAGAAAGGLSGGAVSLMANSGQGVTNTIDNTKTVTKKAFNTVTQPIVKAAERNTGVTPDVKEALETGNDETILATDKDTGEAVKAEEAIVYSIKKASEEGISADEKKKHVDTAIAQLHPLREKLVDGTITQSEYNILNRQYANLKVVLASSAKQQQDNINDVVSQAEDGTLTDSPENTEKLKNAVTGFGNSDLSNPHIAEKVDKQIQTLLDSDTVQLDDATREKLESISKMAKSMNQVNQEVFYDDVEGKYIGINTYKAGIVAALDSNNVPLAKNTLEKLDRFKQKHAIKFNELKAAYEAAKKPFKERTSADKEAIAIANQRRTLKGQKYHITANSGNLITTIESEVSALNTAVESMTALTNLTDIVNNSNSDSDSNTDTTQTTGTAKASKSAVESVNTSEATSSPVTPKNTVNSSSEPVSAANTGTSTGTVDPVNKGNSSNSSNVNSTATESVTAPENTSKSAPKTESEPASSSTANSTVEKSKTVSDYNQLKEKVKEETKDTSPTPSVKGLQNKAAELEKQHDVTTPKGEKAFKKARKALYQDAYTKIAKAAQDEGVEVNLKNANKIREGKFSKVEFVEKQIKLLESQREQLRTNRKLKQELNTLREKAPGLGVHISQQDIDIIENQEYKNRNVIPKVFERIKDKIDKAESGYDTRKGLFSSGRAQIAHTRDEGNTVVFPGSANPLLEWFEWTNKSTDKKNILQTTVDAFNEFRDLLNFDSLTDEQRQAVKQIVEMHDRFVEAFFENFIGRPDGFQYQDAINFLLKDSDTLDIKNLKKEDIDSNVVTAMFIAGSTWLRNKGDGTVYNYDRDINGILGFNDEKRVVKPHERYYIGDRGVPVSVTSRNELGSQVLQLLGIKAKSDTHSDIAQALEDSLTNQILGTLRRLNLVEFSKVPSWLIADLKKEESLEDIQKKAVDRKNRKYEETTFVKVKTEVDPEYGTLKAVSTEDKTGPSDFIDALKQSERLFEETFDVESSGTLPSFEKPSEDSVVSLISNSMQKVSDKIKKKLGIDQQTAYGINQKSLANLRYFGEKTLLRMAGFVEESEYKGKVHKTKALGIEGKNNTLVREMKNFMKFLQGMPTEDSAFYLRKSVQKSHRMSPDHMITPQGSKLHRSLVMVKSHEVQVDPTDEVQVNKLLRAIAASLGIKVESLGNTEMKNALRAKLSQEVFREGVRALRERADTQEAKDKIEAAVKEGGEALWSLDGLTAYADFLDAMDSDNKLPFTVTLFREPDGITNGVAIALLQFVTNVGNAVRRLRRVGIYTSPSDSYVNYRQRGGDDSYQDVARKWGQGIEAIKSWARGERLPKKVFKSIGKSVRGLEKYIPTSELSNTVNAITSLVGEFTTEDASAISEEGRKLSKDPLMTSNYGAGLKKIMAVFANNRLNSIYEKVTPLALIVKNDDDKYSQEEVDAALAELKTIFGSLRAIVGDIDTRLVIKDPVNWELNNNQLTAWNLGINAVYKQPLENTFEAEYGDIVKRRRFLNNAIGISFQVFKAEYERRYNALVKEANSNLPSRDKIKELNESMLELMPIFKGVFSEDRESGILAANQVYKGTANGRGIKTDTRFKHTHPVNRFTRDLKEKQTHSGEDGEKTLSSRALEPTWEINVTAPPITAIHNIDAATMLETISQVEATNIHDAALFNLLEAEEGTQALNKAFFEVNRDNSIMVNMYKSYHNAIVFETNRNKAAKKGILKELNKIVLEEKLAGLDDDFEPVNIYAFNKEFQQVVKENEAQRAKLFKLIKQVNQYTDGPGTEYVVGAKEKTVFTEEELTGFLKEAIQTTKELAIKKAEEEVQQDIAQSEAINSKKNKNNNESFGSEGNSDFIKDFRADLEREITDKNVKEIYEALGENDPIKDSPEHDSRLRNLLDTLITKAIKPTMLYIQEKGDSNVAEYNFKHNAVYMSNAMPSSTSVYSTRMSQRETYVHELIHAIAHAMIDGNSLAARQLRKFYLEIKNAKKPDGTPWLTAKDFMENPDLDKSDPMYHQEMKFAQARYDYIFGDKRGTRVNPVVNIGTNKSKLKQLHNGHHEFLSIALTNEAFIKKLATYDSSNKKQVNKDGSWLERFTNWVKGLLDKFVSFTLFGKDKNASLDEKLVILAGHLAGIDNRNKHVLWTQMEKMGTLVGTGFDKLAAAIIAPVKAVVYSQQASRLKSRTGQLLVRTARAIPYSEELIKALKISAEAMNLAHDGIVISILHEIQGQNKDNLWLHDLKRTAQHFVDKVRMDRYNNTRQFIQDAYLTDITEDDNKALSNLIMTDAISLFDINEGAVKHDGDYLEKVYNDTVFREKEIAKVIQIIKSNFKSSHQQRYYIAMATSMGQEMVTGESIQKVSIMNAKIIAEMDGTSYHAKGDTALAEKLIERLATLNAIKFTDPDIRKRVGKVIKAEFAANKVDNGITATLGLHSHNKTEAKEKLFKGSEKLFNKGYHKEKFSDNVSFVMAPASMHDALVKEGFVRQTDAFEKDSTDPNGTEMFMYVSKANTMGKWISGVVSMTGKRAKGTKLAKIFASQGVADPGIAALLDRPVIKAKKMAQLDDIARGYTIDDAGNKTATEPRIKKEGNLAPVFNSRGEMVDFRYKMNESTKRIVLGKDYALDNMLAYMEANIVDKTNSAFINKELIQKAYDFFQKNATKKQKGIKKYTGYVEIGPNSPHDNYREIYYMLPEEFKEQIREIWGTDSMYVKAEEASFIFGEREMLLSNWKSQEYSDTNTVIQNSMVTLNRTMSFLLNRKSVKYIEAVWKEVIAMAKDAIVVKSGVVLLGNIISNTVLLKTMGVSLKDIGRYHAEAFVELRKHRKDTEELARLILENKSNPQARTKNEARMVELRHDIAINPVTELIDAGMFQHIVEDVNLNEEDGYKGKLETWLNDSDAYKRVSKATPNIVKTVAKNVVMTHDTQAYKFLRDMTQASDFIARYTLHQHHKKHMADKMTPKQSLDLITKTFVNYAPPTHRWLQYANDMGMVMFTKFFLRIQGVLLYLARMHPGGLLATMVGQGLTVDVSDIGESFLLFGVDHKITNPWDIAQEIINSPGSIRLLDNMTEDYY